MDQISLLVKTAQCWATAQAAMGTPCATCHYWAGWTAQGTAALCAHPRCSRVRSTPEGGCCCWEREPGSDDEIRLRPLHSQEWQPFTVTAVPRPS